MFSSPRCARHCPERFWDTSSVFFSFSCSLSFPYSFPFPFSFLLLLLLPLLLPLSPSLLSFSFSFFFLFPSLFVSLFSFLQLLILTFKTNHRNCSPRLFNTIVELSKAAIQKLDALSNRPLILSSPQHPLCLGTSGSPELLTEPRKTFYYSHVIRAYPRARFRESKPAITRLDHINTLTMLEGQVGFYSQRQFPSQLADSWEIFSNNMELLDGTTTFSYSQTLVGDALLI